MGDQFRPDQRHLLQKAYAAFYWAINLGSFFATLAIPYIRKQWGYSWAFGVPGIFMALATFVFWLGSRHYVRVPPSRETRKAGFVLVFLEAYRRQTGKRFGPLLNLVTTIALPLVAMVLLAMVALARQMTPTLRFLDWTALGIVGLWYGLILLLSVLRRSELPAAFWQAARSRYQESEIAAARSVQPHSLCLCPDPRLLGAVRPNLLHLGAAR